MNIQQYVDTIVINSENEILFLRRSNHDTFMPGKLTLPGGKLDNTDVSIYQGAMRELAEETALLVNHKDYLEHPMFAFQNLDRSITHYAIVNCLKNYLLVLNSDEHQDYFWLKLDQINQEDLAFAEVLYRIITILELNPGYLTNQPLVKSILPRILKADAYDLGLITADQYLSKSNKAIFVEATESLNIQESFYVK